MEYGVCLSSNTHDEIHGEDYTEASDESVFKVEQSMNIKMKGYFGSIFAN